MIRIVLAGLADDHWRTYRQTQWMGEVRDSPDLAMRPRLHFDLDETSYRNVLRDWESSGAFASRDAALALLLQAGAVEVRRS
jgi:DTW domain-containing protein YfiP